MKNHHRRPTVPARRGSALVLALLVMMVLVGLGTSFLLIANSASKRQAAETDNLRAFYLAEAGLAESFQALRIGRSGQLASAAEPAVHGDGLLWVDAEDTADDQVSLTSTALCGTGRASLALVVEPVDIPLGFFSDEDLVVDSVLLVDGFDPEEATYEEEIGALFDLREYIDWLASLLGEEVLIQFLDRGGSGAPQDLADMANLCEQQAAELVSLFPDLREAYLAGTLFPPAKTVDRIQPIEVLPIDSDDYQMLSDSLIMGAPLYLDPNDPVSGDVGTVPDGGGTQASLPTEYTDSGGLLSSNGSVLFNTPSGEPIAILGDVIPGPEGSVEGLGSVQVTGDTEPRPVAIELPQVDVPPIPMAHPIRHDELLPLLIPPGESGHERIEVAADAELILRGPATVVIGSLVLEPGALLTLDTRDGDVALYVTGGLDLQPGSAVTTSSDFPDELSIQVAGIPNGPDGAPVKLEATSQFHGTIFAPDTEVVVGSAFEVYGGIVAQRLLLGPGARLHFDNSEYEGSPIPKVVSWRIVEIPSAVRNRRADPYAAMGVERDALPALSEAHDLASVDLTIEYLDHGGIQRTFTGREDQFDWRQVASVVDLEREALRQPDQPSDYKPPDEGPDELALDIRPLLQDMFDRCTVEGFPTGGRNFVDRLIPNLPLSADEWTGIYAIPHDMDPLQLRRLKNADREAGGTGG